MTHRKPLDNIELRMAQQETKRRFDQLLFRIQALPEIKRDPYVLTACQNFRHCFGKREQYDVASLPYRSQQAESLKEPKKVLCVLSLISYTVQMFWVLLEGNLHQAIAINRNLDKLENYIMKGLQAYAVVGKAYNPGYWLKEIM